MNKNKEKRAKKAEENAIIAFLITIAILIVVPSVVYAWNMTAPSLIGQQVGWDIFIEHVEPPAEPEPYKFEATPFVKKEITSFHRVDGKNVAIDSGGTQLYCIDKDAEMELGDCSVYHAVSYGEVRELGGSNPTSWGWTCPQHNDAEDELGKVSHPWFLNHGALDWMNSADIDLAYILTYPDIMQWSEEKQRAVWARFNNEAGNDIRDQGTQYTEYFNEAQNGQPDFEPDIKIDGNDEKAEVVADYKDNTLTIGPFDLKYINKNLDENGNRAAFSGVSAMYFWGINSDGKVVNYRVPIKEFIDASGKKYELKAETYYRPTHDDGFVDHNEQVYPKGDGEFYVILDNPNKGKLNTDSSYIKELMFVVELQYMGVTAANGSDIDTYKYTIGTYEHKFKKCHVNCRHSKGRYRCHWDCYFASANGETSLQDNISFHYGERKVWMRTIYGTKHINISMDLGGNVWVDAVQGKESLADGFNNSSEDYPIANIRVTLWAKPERSTSKTVDASDEYVTCTYTNEYGNYLFENINVLRKYYVTFEYDGQQYLPTDYLKAASGQSVDSVVKSGGYNTENWKITSKGKESDTDRDNYDRRFEEIGSSPASYAVYDILNGTGLTNGYNDAYNKYELMGFILDENGNYYRDESKALIDSFYTIEGGNIVETTEQTEGLISQAIKQYMEQQATQGYVNGIEQEQNKFEEYVDAARGNSQGKLIDESKVEHYRKHYQDMLDEAKKYVEQSAGEIAEGTLEYKKVPNDKNDLLDVYAIVEGMWGGDREELWKKLQFIQDAKILAYTQNAEKQADIYPVYDKVFINSIKDGQGKDVKYDTIEAKFEAYYGLKDVKPKKIVKDGVEITYEAIYPGQLQVNLGLWRRQEVDLALRKDILYAATRINGKTEVYSYNKRDEFTEEQKEALRAARKQYEQNGRQPADYQAYLQLKADFEKANLEASMQDSSKGGYWQIQLRMRDYNNYYGSTDDAGKGTYGENYTKELYTADYNYRSANTNKVGEDKELQLYVTYKVTVRNQSQSILGEITEIVDYYDKDYTYRDDLSWVMYKQNSDSNNLEEVNFTESDYYDTIDKLKLNDKISANNKGTKSSTTGQYEARSGKCKSDMTSDYNDVYIQGLAGKKLASGEEAYIYLTFEVRKDGNNAIILDDGNYGNNTTLKQNYSEINGYKTYYKDGTQLPNDIVKGSNDPAGIVDINSTPGNLCKKDLEGNKYEKNFENDTDRAKSIKVTVKEDFIRSINGTVWEDERTKNVSEAIIGDGMRTSNDKVKVAGVTVDLVERIDENGKVREYVWRTTTTDSDGKYEFKTDQNNKIYIIPGNYFIRFHYGNTTATANTGGSNVTSYNGQDFKSTVYQKDMRDGKELDEYKDTKIEGYDGKYQGTEVGYYDIYQLDDLRSKNKKDFSDAKDIWAYRERAINYSNNQVTNAKAEILASPYTTGDTAELIKNTQMTAVTGLIVLEGEYNRTSTDGYASTSNGKDEYKYENDTNGKYTLNNVDFGLTERPKAQLELDKKITNVQIKLANGSILFDANKAMTDLMWPTGNKGHKAYNVDDGISGGKYPEYYGNNHRYAYRTLVDALVLSRYDGQGNNGLIVATMDEELMQGANIAISYLLTVTNVGETDYDGQDFYYKGVRSGNTVTTSADIVADYVANNLNFNANARNNNEDKSTNKEDNGWSITTSGKLETSSSAQTGAKQYNNIISTPKLGVALTPGNDTTVGLVLTQLINPENSSDDKTYDNIAEITTISNTVGRRMAYSIQGNQDPTKIPAEVDSIKSEQVRILPPFGSGNTVVYIAIAVSVLVILAGGIILIKKKVLNK